MHPMKKLPYLLILLITLTTLLQSCESTESKPDTTYLSELSDKEILQIFIDAGINPDAVAVESFNQLRKNNHPDFQTASGLRKFLKERTEMSNRWNKEYHKALDSLGEIEKKRFK